MAKKILYTREAGEPIGPYSQGVRIGNLVFTSGQIGAVPDTGQIAGPDIEAETHQVMKNLGAILNVEGLNYGHVLKATIFLANMNDFGRMNEVYGSYFPAGSYPARETVQVSRLPKNVNVEISVIAAADA